MKMPLGTTLCVMLAVAATVAIRADLNVGADLKVSPTDALPQVRSAGLHAGGSALQAGRNASQAGGGAALQASQPTSGSSAAVLSKYCITCHNEKRKTAGLAIDTLDVQRVGADAEVWER